MVNRMRSMIFVAIVAVFALLCTPLRAKADGTGIVEGVVKNASGQPLSGAYVKLHDAEMRLTFMVISQAQGRYSAKNLPPGKYVVQGIGNGFQSAPMPVEVSAEQAGKGRPVAFFSPACAISEWMAGTARKSGRRRNVDA